MAKSGSLTFPFKEEYLENSLKRAETAADIIKSAMTCFLLTSPGQRRGNPIGSSLPSYLHSLISESKLGEIAGTIKEELVTQFPGVSIVNIEATKGFSEDSYTLKLTITFSAPYTDIEQLEVSI